MYREKILGPPGCGKTSKLIKLLEEELKNGTRPDKIAFLTFTRAARFEALQRIKRTEKEFPYLKTIHSICYHSLGIGKDQIVRPDTLKEFAQRMGIKLTGAMHDPFIEEFNSIDQTPTQHDLLLAANHMGRHRKIGLHQALNSMNLTVDDNMAIWFTRAYKEWKRATGLFDYTDLLTRYSEHGKSLPIETLVVDEAQDLSLLQWDVVRKLGANAERSFFAGDDDQCVFYWAGADANSFQDLKCDKTTVLAQSYRLSKAVHKLATRISGRIKKRLIKEYAPTSSEGEVGQAGFLTSMEFKEKTFILFRNNYRGLQIAQSLKEDQIPYIGKASPLQEPEVRLSLLAWQQLVRVGETSQHAAKSMLRFSDPDFFKPNPFEIIRNKPKVSVDDLLIREPRLKDWYAVMHKLPRRDDIASLVSNFDYATVAAPRIELLSIHQSKGREAHTVVIDPEMSRATYLGMVDRPDDEHRVWYVACTRAKERVLFLLPDGLYAYKF